MRRRLRITFVSLIACVLAGLAIPLALALAARSAQAMYIDRLNDAARFASLAEPALRTGRIAALTAEVGEYDQIYGIAVGVVGRDGHTVLASRAGWDAPPAGVRAPVAVALAGRQVGLGRAFWPWDGDPMVVAVPVDSDGEVIGAVVTVSPTAALRRQTGLVLLAVGGLSAVALVAGNLATGPLARWLLRPVERLDQAAAALSAGTFVGPAAADQARVETDSGPPELRRLAASFNRMADRVVAMLARQRSFVSYASHQLRTPLATLRLAVENLGDAVRPDGRADYRAVVEEIERMGQLCDALLTYARAEVIAADTDGLRTIEAVATVRGRVGAWRGLAERAGVTLHQGGIGHAVARVTAQALDQALDALLSNAVKFAGRGSAVTVSVEAPEAAWVDIHVVDDGPGMPPEDLARAAEAFWRRPGDQNVDGTGLGITIAEALVTASGGRFSLAPAIPHGLHARIRLPAPTPASSLSA